MTAASDLPMEVWARVAVHVPFAERLRTFHALRRTGCLPRTHTNAPNAFMQFCSEADRAERAAAEEDAAQRWAAAHESVRLLVGMGFAESEVREALRRSHGALDDAVEALLATL